MTDAYTERRTRVATQVCSQWVGDDWSDDQMLTVIAAADMAFTANICDLDWEAATLARLKHGEAS